MNSEEARGADVAAAQRQERFGELPDRVRHEQLIEEKAATPKGRGSVHHDPEGSWNHFSCLAFDLGL